MRFILTDNAISNLEFLRYQYQIERKINLNDKPSIIGLPTMFGGINVVERKSQIAFLEQMHTILKPLICKEEDIKTPEQLNEHIAASRMMIAACLYVQSHINYSKRNSVLFRLIEDNLCINDDNYLDDEDKEACFLTASRLINSSKINLEKSNSILVNEGIDPISEKEWRKFANFLEEQTKTVSLDNHESEYPITAMTGPFFRMGLTYSGATVGMLMGETLSNASYVIGPKTKITAMIGTTLIVVGHASPTGIAIFAPVIAGKLISAFCSISLAHILSSTMGLIGQGIGVGVGIPLDVGYRLIKKTCKIIGDYCKKEQENPEMTGYRLADGLLVVNGITVQILPENKIPKDYVKQIIEIKEDGHLYVDGQQTKVPFSGIQLPKNSVQELRSLFKAKEEHAVEEESKQEISMANQV